MKRRLSLTRLSNRRGVTLVEVMMTTMILGIMSMIGVMLFAQVLKYSLRSQIRNTMTNQARVTMDAATKFIRQGKSDTISICSCPTTACSTCVTPPSSAPPNSRIEFDLYSGTAVKIYWSSSSAYLKLNNQNPQLLAQNVTYMTFGLDPSDPTLVNFSLRLDRAVDARQTETLFLPNQQIRMVGASETK